jgi:hypothetical protein
VLDSAPRSAKSIREAFQARSLSGSGTWRCGERSVPWWLLPVCASSRPPLPVHLPPDNRHAARRKSWPVSTSPTVWWELTGPARALVRGAWYASWAGLFYSLWLSGFGYQTGGTPWWQWVRQRPQPPRPFHPRGAFLRMRHPAYLGFLGLVWCTPVMSPDRAILIASWTLYVLIGSWLKDERLAWYIGEPYRVYMSQVVGYPGISAGPLAKRPLEPREKASDAVAAPVSALLATSEPVDRQTLVTASILTREPG